jgi:hypothetical protein
MITNVGHQLLQIKSYKSIRYDMNTYYWAIVQPKISNVKPTEAKKARSTTLDKRKISNICIPLRKILALKKNKT